jgi:hypothetical protein
MPTRTSRGRSETIPVLVGVQETSYADSFAGQPVTSRAIEKLEVNLDELKGEVRSIAARVGDLADASDIRPSGYRLSQFQVALAIEAGGHVGLLGTGIDLTGTATFTLIFDRSAAK